MPTCRNNNSDEEYFPFCCETCKLVDLYNWLNEENIISTPVSEEDIED